MMRGELYRVRNPVGDPKPNRVYVIVSRDGLIESSFPRVICAPVHSQRQGVATEVHVGPREGLKHESTILCDALQLVEKRRLTDFVGELSLLKTLELDQALRVALGVD